MTRDFKGLVFKPLNPTDERIEQVPKHEHWRFEEADIEVRVLVSVEGKYTAFDIRDNPAAIDEMLKHTLQSKELQAVIESNLKLALASGAMIGKKAGILLFLGLNISTIDTANPKSDIIRQIRKASGTKRWISGICQYSYKVGILPDITNWESVKAEDLEEL